jgi:iron complex transport system permease protein
LLLVLLAVAVLVALSVGRYPLPVRDIVQFVLAAAGLVDMPQDRYDLLHNVIVQIRLPRVLTAVLVGGALAASGAAFQAVFRNPLVSPELMGRAGGGRLRRCCRHPGLG